MKAIFVLMAICVGLTGCATSRSTLSVSVPPSVPSTTQNGKTVLINSVADNRSFEASPSSPEIPSLDPSEDQSTNVKLRAVGRKRNTYGKGLGDLVLKEGTTIGTVTSSAIASAFAENGYRVITNESEATTTTVVVDASVTKFWSWMNPGFWAITLSAEIETDLKIKNHSGNTPKKISVKAADSYQVAAEANWVEVIEKALRLYVAELKAKIE